MKDFREDLFELVTTALGVLTELFINDKISFDTYIESIDTKYDFIMNEISRS